MSSAAVVTGALRFKNIRIYHECEDRIEKSARGSLFGITRLT